VNHFTYKALDRQGQPVSGVIEAVDRKSAISLLAEKGQFVIDLATGDKKAVESTIEAAFVRSRVGSRELVQMTEQMMTALKAGLPVLQTLQIIAKQQHKPALRSLLEELAGDVKAGRSLSEAMARHPEVFSPLYVSMVQVGETGGILEETMEQLVRLLQREQKIQGSLKSASIYPLFVLTLGLISVTIVLVWIMPQLLEAMDIEYAALPLPTKVLMGISHFLVYWGWLAALATGAGVYLFMRWKATAKGRFQFDAFKLKSPLLGKVLRTLAVGRFARTLGALTKCGIPILESLAVVRDTLGNAVLEREMDRVAESVKTGSSLAEPMEQSGLFDPLLVQIVSIGEQTGKLDEMLLQAAATFDEQADTVLQRFMAIFPALLILILAAIVFFLIASILLPILGMDLSVYG
jgi:type II secretory pathway component PulF